MTHYILYCFFNFMIIPLDSYSTNEECNTMAKKFVEFTPLKVVVWCEKEDRT